MKDYIECQNLQNENPEYCYVNHGESYILFLLVIAILEMMTQKGRLKRILRMVIIFVLIGNLIPLFIPNQQIYFGVHNTVWFIATVAVILIMKNIGNRIQDKLKASR